MNTIIHALLWCAVQVTVLAIAALAIGTVVVRRRPAAGALVAAAALLAVSGLTATARSPVPAWPISWDRLAWRQATRIADTTADHATPPATMKLPTTDTGF